MIGIMGHFGCYSSCPTFVIQAKCDIKCRQIQGCPTPTPGDRLSCRFSFQPLSSTPDSTNQKARRDLQLLNDVCFVRVELKTHRDMQPGPSAGRLTVLSKMSSFQSRQTETRLQEGERQSTANKTARDYMTSVDVNDGQSERRTRGRPSRAKPIKRIAPNCSVVMKSSIRILAKFQSTHAVLAPRLPTVRWLTAHHMHYTIKHACLMSIINRVMLFTNTE